MMAPWATTRREEEEEEEVVVVVEEEGRAQATSTWRLQSETNEVTTTPSGTDGLLFDGDGQGGAASSPSLPQPV
ncbi:hypothetical protein [Oryza sativa Japonica Group]|uniref:Uncharacterized protein n=1 Tax=Oryza sativa subsp. japonica TaxID=39947 RepID=Q5JLN2_ORYSJ|nr:hypothetical protein [Oryza sativa Japonica Group]